MYPGIKNIKEKAPMNPEDIPGLIEGGWRHDGITQNPTPRQRSLLYRFLKKMVLEVQENSNAWPFIEPVSGVADYYDVIKEPMGINPLTRFADA